ncbi:MAG: hypothetical protein WCG97_03655 [bacterium]
MNTSKKSYTKFLYLSILITVIFFCYQYYTNRNSPTEYKPTELSTGWLTYKSEQGGFHFKYPSNWTITRGPNGVSLFDNFRISFGKISVQENIDDLKKSQRMGDICDANYDVVTIMNISAKKITCKRLHYYNQQSMKDKYYFSKETHLYIEKNNFTYDMWFTSGEENSYGEIKLSETELNEIVSTFQIDNIMNSDYVNFVHPKYGYSMTYPSSWQILYADDISLLSSTGDVMLIYTKENDSLENYTLSREKEFKKCTPKKEFFASKTIGIKCTYYGETYYFEKNKNLYIIDLGQQPNNSNDVFAPVLESFKI